METKIITLNRISHLNDDAFIDDTYYGTKAELDEDITNGRIVVLPNTDFNKTQHLRAQVYKQDLGKLSEDFIRYFSTLDALLEFSKNEGNDRLIKILGAEVF